MANTAHATRAQALASTIEREIVERGLGEGDVLGTIESWRASSGFARATVSEAVRLLVDRGLVDIKPGRGGGIFVARTGPVVRLRHTLLSVHGEAPTLVDVIAIREALEPLIVMDATCSRNAAALRRLRSGLALAAESLDDHDRFIRSIWALHETIAGITPNEMLNAMYLAMMQVINERAESARGDESIDSPTYRRHRLAVHEQLVAAIESGDPGLASLALEAHAWESR